MPEGLSMNNYYIPFVIGMSLMTISGMIMLGVTIQVELFNKPYLLSWYVFPILIISLVVGSIMSFVFYKLGGKV